MYSNFSSVYTSFKNGMIESVSIDTDAVMQCMELNGVLLK